jgi:ribose/xylose/arabinose/galactoside ABC-type transport system permease subunit
MWHWSGTFTDAHGAVTNSFLNARSLLQITVDTSYIAIMAVGATIVIISGGIDLSVGSIYALAGTSTALLLHHSPHVGVWTPLALCLGIGLLCGLLNGAMVSMLRVHPFIITLGTMGIFRGVALITSKAESIGFPDSATDTIKASLGLDPSLHPVPGLAMVAVCVLGWLYLTRTAAGRSVFAVGGNEQAARYSGLQLWKVHTGVYAISGLTAGIAAFIGCAYYGSAGSVDASGYELRVIAAAVVGGASLTGGKGGATGALLGALLMILISQAITFMSLDRNYESIIIGAAVIIAVLLDQWSRKLALK